VDLWKSLVGKQVFLSIGMLKTLAHPRGSEMERFQDGSSSEATYIANTLLHASRS